MAIAFDSNSTGATTGATSVSFSHTCSGSDRILFVLTECNGAHASGVTYNGVSLTNILTDTGGSGGDLWYLIAPATGANNIVVSVAVSNFIVAVASSYTGVSQTGFPDSSAKENFPADNAATESISTTTVANNCWVVGGAFVNANAATTAGANTTIRQSNSNASGGLGIGDNNAAITPAGSATLNFVSSSAGRAGFIVSIAPVSAATPKLLTLLGVGS